MEKKIVFPLQVAPPPLHPSAAERLEARRGGVIGECVAALAADDDALVLIWLGKLKGLLRDEDCVVEFANRGGDSALLKLLQSQNTDVAGLLEEVMECRMACTVPGRGFPSKALPREADPPYPVCYSFPLPGSDVMLSITCRLVPSRMSSHADVGNILWPCAILHGRWMLAHTALFAGQRVLEIGAGVGMLGLVATHVCRKVVFSDYSPVLVDNVRYNIAVNCSDADAALADDFTGIRGGTSASCACGRPSCLSQPAVACARRCVGTKLDWEDVSAGDVTIDPDAFLADDDDPDGKFAVIVGSDIVYRKEDVHLIAQVLKAYLKPSGVAYLSSPPPRSRFGVQFTKPVLEEEGFLVQCIPLTNDSDLLSAPPLVGEARDVVADCGYGDEIDLFTVTFPP